MKVGFREESCEDRGWMELTRDRVRWRGLVVTVLKLQVLVPHCLLLRLLLSLQSTNMYQLTLQNLFFTAISFRKQSACVHRCDGNAVGFVWLLSASTADIRNKI
jgi:hypothetical protein